MRKKNLALSWPNERGAVNGATAPFFDAERPGRAVPGRER